jgi:hypothetical protein
MSQVFTARPRPHPSPAAAVALDFGLRVRINAQDQQRTLFSGGGSLSLQELCSELGLMISEFRVRSFAVRHELEQLTEALLVNVRCGFWPLARRAAIDLGDLLAHARRRRLADAELCYRGWRCAEHIAQLCAREVRR